MADLYTSSMFGGEFPYWKDKYGWDFQRDERYPEKLDDLQENRLLAEGLNMAGITPDMDLGDIRKKYKSEFKGISNEEIHSFLEDVFTKAGIDTGFTYGDANSMFRKFLNLKGMLREPDKKDWPTIDIDYGAHWLSPRRLLRDPVASIDPAVWDEKMRRDGEVVETVDWVDPGQQVGPERVPSFDDTGIYPGVPRTGDPDFEEDLIQQMINKRDLMEVGTFNLEDKTVGKMPFGVEPWYGDRALLDIEAASAFLEMERDHGGDLAIDSALRSKLHNIAAGGETDSKHLKGLSIDITDPVARDWITKNGEKYGWKLANYWLPATRTKPRRKNTNHFNYTRPINPTIVT